MINLEIKPLLQYQKIGNRLNSPLRKPAQSPWPPSCLTGSSLKFPGNKECKFPILPSPLCNLYGAHHPHSQCVSIFIPILQFPSTLFRDMERKPKEFLWEKEKCSSEIQSRWRQEKHEKSIKKNQMLLSPIVYRLKRLIFV